MTKQITVNGKEIIVLGVPEGSSNFKKGYGLITYSYDGREEIKFIEFDGNCSFQILGTLTADTIDFDCEAFVKSINSGRGMAKKIYRLYDSLKNTTSKEDSFRSLLTSHGFNFKNPLGKQPISIFSDHPDWRESKMYQNSEGYKQWKKYEDSLVHKLVMVEKL